MYPASQTVHTLALDRLNFPPSQVSQLVEPDDAAKVPAVHELQVLDPILLAYFPISQVAQLPCPARGCAFPTSQEEHEADPGLSL